MTEISESSPRLSSARRAQLTIISTAFTISVCGISYELLSGAISSYFLGNAVLQYSLTIGFFLFAMGIGSYISRMFDKNLLESFIIVQMLVGLIGGFSTFILFSAYGYTEVFSLLFYVFLLVLGALVGLEIPLLIRILKDYEALKFSISDILAFDYVGALLASILFPLLVLPHMGLMHASFFYGIMGIVVVFFNISIFSFSGFNSDEILNWKALLNALKNDKDPAIGRIMEFLDSKGKKVIEDWDFGKKLSWPSRDSIISALNGILKRRDFYDKDIFGNLKLEKNAKKLLERGIDKLNTDSLRILNRLLIESVFPGVVARAPVFWGIIRRKKTFLASAIIITLILATGLLFSSKFVSFFETRLYGDEIIFSKQTKYQKIILTRYGDDLRLFLDGGLQFSSWDEYRYHESLVHPAMSLTSNREEVLILGGGDGLAAREILKYPDVKRITLVDIDPDIINLCKTDPQIKRLNKNSLNDPRMNIVVQDAYKYLEESNERFGVIIGDLPDPANESLSKLYTVGYFKMLKHHLAKGGVGCIQSTTPYFARRTFWCIIHTTEKAGLYNKPFHVFIPSMGDWGFSLVSDHDFDPSDIEITIEDTEFLQKGKITDMFYFGKDIEEVPTEVNTLNSHKILQYYEKEWKKWE